MGGCILAYNVAVGARQDSIRLGSHTRTNCSWKLGPLRLKEVGHKYDLLPVVVMNKSTDTGQKL